MSTKRDPKIGNVFDRGVPASRPSRRQALQGLLAGGGLLFGAATGSGLLAACSSSAAGSKSGDAAPKANLQKARAIVRAAEAPPSQFTPPGAAFAAGSARGKTVFFIGDIGVPQTSSSVAGFRAGLAKAGVSLKTFDDNSQLPDASRGVAQGVSLGVDAIVVNAITSSLLAQDYARARAAKIPVIEIEVHDTGQGKGGVLPGEPNGVIAACDLPHSAAGRLMAAFAVADSQGSVNAIGYPASDAPGISNPERMGIQAEAKALCPGCTVRFEDIPAAQITARSGPLAQANVSSNPNVNYLFPFFDIEATFMIPAVHAAGGSSRVKIVTFNASPDVLKSLAANDVVAADVGADNERFGWTWADQTLRVLTGNQPVNDVKLPLRLFTRNNIHTIDLNGAPSNWYGGRSYQGSYAQLWQLA